MGEMLDFGMRESGRGDVAGDASVPLETPLSIEHGPTGDGPPTRLPRCGERDRHVAEGTASQDMALKFDQGFRVTDHVGVGQQCPEGHPLDRGCAPFGHLHEAGRGRPQAEGVISLPQPVTGLLFKVSEEQTDHISLLPDLLIISFEPYLLRDIPCKQF
nr:hypothetical protein [Lichenibacterium minor]